MQHIFFEIKIYRCESRIFSKVEALRTRTSNEYEEEYGLFLYNATWILDNNLSIRTSQMFVLL